MGKGQLTSINNQQNLCKSSIYYESIFATKVVGHYLANHGYVSTYLWSFLHEGTYDFLKAISSNHLQYLGNLVSHRCQHGKWFKFNLQKIMH